MWLVKPGQQFRYAGTWWLRIKGITGIDKKPYNLVHPSSGELGFVAGETAVKIAASIVLVCFLVGCAVSQPQRIDGIDHNPAMLKSCKSLLTISGETV